MICVSSDFRSGRTGGVCTRGVVGRPRRKPRRRGSEKAGSAGFSMGRRRLTIEHQASPSRPPASCRRFGLCRYSCRTCSRLIEAYDRPSLCCKSPSGESFYERDYEEDKRDYILHIICRINSMVTALPSDGVLQAPRWSQSCWARIRRALQTSFRA